jgi:hypothetical protein
MSLMTFHFGSRYPKRYCKPEELPVGVEEDPRNPVLHPNQPGFVKCRIKIRLDEADSFMDHVTLVQNTISNLDHKEMVWIAGTDTSMANLLAKVFDIAEIREFEPEEEDD